MRTRLEPLTTKHEVFFFFCTCSTQSMVANCYHRKTLKTPAQRCPLDPPLDITRCAWCCGESPPNTKANAPPALLSYRPRSSLLQQKEASRTLGKVMVSESLDPRWSRSTHKGITRATLHCRDALQDACKANASPTYSFVPSPNSGHCPCAPGSASPLQQTSTRISRCLQAHTAGTPARPTPHRRSVFYVLQLIAEKEAQRTFISQRRGARK